MILTVTPNTSLDHIMFVPSFGLNQTIRASQVVQSMGGKPTDAAWILGELGISSLALGFAAGQVGKQVETMLRQRGVVTNFIWVEGESRRNVVIICEDGSGQSTITDASLRFTQTHIAQLKAQYQQALKEATGVVLGGTLPTGMSPDFYTDYIQAAHAQNIPVIFDASGPFLSAGLAGQPTYVKPNRDELAQIVGQPITSLALAYEAGREIQARYQTSPIITLGEQGAIAILPHATYRIPPIKVKVINTAGAGDGVLAGLAASIYRKQPIEMGLKWGFAAATAVLMTPGTADCRRSDVETLVDQVELIPWWPQKGKT